MLVALSILQTETAASLGQDEEAAAAAAAAAPRLGRGDKSRSATAGSTSSRSLMSRKSSRKSQRHHDQGAEESDEHDDVGDGGDGARDSDDRDDRDGSDAEGERKVHALQISADAASGDLREDEDEDLEDVDDDLESELCGFLEKQSPSGWAGWQVPISPSLFDAFPSSVLLSSVLRFDAHVVRLMT